MTDGELEGVLRPWLQRALAVLHSVDNLSEANDDRASWTEPPKRDTEATRLVESIGHCERWAEITDIAIRHGVPSWIESGIVASSGPDSALQMLEAFWSVHELRLRLIKGTNATGKFTWSSCRDPLFNATIRRLENAGLLTQEPASIEPESKPDGLNELEKTFIWGGHAFTDLAAPMMEVLAILHLAYPSGRWVSLDEMRSKTLGKFDYGFYKVFDVKRGQKKKVPHPVKTIILGKAKYRLIDPESLKDPK